MQKKIILKITGMTCASCAIGNEKALTKTKGVLSANVNFATKKAVVEYDADILDEEQIKKAVRDNGYDIEEAPSKEHAGHAGMQMQSGGHEHGGEDIQKNWRTFLWSALLSVPLMVSMLFEFESGQEILGKDLVMWLQLILATAVVFYFGWRFHRMAWKQARHFRANMDTLISMGTLTAYFYSLWAFFSGAPGYFETAALIITLILLGKYFEAKSTGQAGAAMRKLMELSAKKARVLIGGAEREMDVDEVKVGDIILVKPSEKIPLDGEVMEGSSNVNEAMLTGESMPAEKRSGSKVFGATFNEDGVLKIKVTQTGEGTVLAQIIRTVEEAQGSKAPIQKLADRISGIFVPAVITIALITFISWFLVQDQFSRALINAVAVLVIACPCALGLATPTAIMVGTGKGAKNGILFKNGESFERAKDISMVVFDKTGTLTKGLPEVQAVISNPQFDFSEEKIIKIAASMARFSEHPLSKAVERYAKEKRVELADFTDFQELRGKGITARCPQHGVQIMLGNKTLLADNAIDTAWAESVLGDEKLGIGTRLFLVHDKKLAGAIIIADEIRNESKKVIEQIKGMGLNVAMITGDNAQTAKFVARDLGVSIFFAEVLPGEKAAKIKRLQEQHEKVVFVGDGINDAPSLVQADLGIAMGSATDIAKEAGQIILMQNNLEKVVEAIKISKMTFGAIKQNLFWAFIYNIIAIPLAISGVLSPIIAAAAMSFSSISVVLNSLRIYRR